MEIYNSNLMKYILTGYKHNRVYICYDIILQFDIHYRFYGTTDDMLMCVNNEAKVENNRIIRRVSTMCAYNIMCMKLFEY